MPPRTERVPASGVVTPARILSSVDLPEPLGPTRPAWSPSNSPNVRPSKSDRVPKALLTASQLSRSGRGIRRYFFSFFGFFFSLRMPLPLAMGSPPLVELSADYSHGIATAEGRRRARCPPSGGRGYGWVLARLTPVTRNVPLSSFRSTTAGPRISLSPILNAISSTLTPVP